jgi:hypothetical protein
LIEVAQTGGYSLVSGKSPPILVLHQHKNDTFIKNSNCFNEVLSIVLNYTIESLKSNTSGLSIVQTAQNTTILAI